MADQDAAARSIALTTIHALGYCRVSKDATGVAQSPAEQRTELERVAKACGWTFDAVVDNDKGASRYSKTVRHGWADVLDRIGRGGIDVLMVWEPSRLTRSLREGLDFVELCESTDTKVNYNGRTWDLSDPYDRNIVLTDITRGEFEVEVTRKRVMRNKAATLAAGRPAGKLLYGYRRVRDERTGQLTGQEPDPATAPVVVEVFERVARGESIRSVQLDLTRRGVAPQGGKLAADETPRPWARTTLGNMLRNRSYLGHRTHGGKVAVENAWPPLVDDGTFERVQVLLADPARRKSQDVRVRHLLAGLLRCEVCGGRVTYRLQRCRNATQYVCKDGGHVAAHAERLEEGVREMLVAWLSEPDALDVWTTTDTDIAGLDAELKALEARLDAVADEVAAGEMSAKMAGRVERDLTPRVDELRATLSAARAEVPAPVAAMAGEHAAEWWDGADIEARRALIRATLRDCELRRSPTRTHRKDLGLRFRWAGKRLYKV